MVSSAQSRGLKSARINNPCDILQTMVRVTMGDVDSEYDLYAIVGLVFSFFFAAAVIFMVAVPTDRLSVNTRDYANGVLLAGALFGVPVSLLLGVSGIVFSKVEHSKGRWMAWLAIIMSLVFLIALFMFWYPRRVGFWSHNFAAVRGVEISE